MKYRLKFPLENFNWFFRLATLGHHTPVVLTSCCIFALSHLRMLQENHLTYHDDHIYKNMPSCAPNLAPTKKLYVHELLNKLYIDLLLHFSLECLLQVISNFSSRSS